MSRTSATHLGPQLGGFLLTQRHRGACTERTAGLFFDDGRPAGRGANKRQEAAKAICRLCPILDACRAYARADPTLEGIWGGETEAERHSARRTVTLTRYPVGENEQGRRLASLAAQRAHRDGLDAAATALKVPAATLRRVFDLYGLDQPPDPAGPLGAPRGGDHPRPPPRRPAATTPSRHRPSRSRPAPATAPHPTTPATRPPDQAPIPQESPPTPAQPEENT